MSHIKAVPNFPEEGFERVVLPYVANGVGMYSREISMRGMSVGIDINLENIEIEYDRFGNVKDVTGVEATIPEPTLDDWRPVVRDFGDLDLASQAEIARDKNKLKEVLKTLPNVQVVLVNRLEHEGLDSERPHVMAFRNGKVYGTLVGQEGRVLSDLIAKLASEKKILEATAGHVIASHQGTYSDGRKMTTHQVEGRLFMPPADRILKWYFADAVSREAMDLSKPATAVFNIKESGKYSSNIQAIISDHPKWSGEADVATSTMIKGKYAGLTRLDFYVDGLQVGSNHPQYQESEQLLFDYVKNGNTKVPVQVKMSYMGTPLQQLEVCLDLDQI